MFVHKSKVYQASCIARHILSLSLYKVPTTYSLPPPNWMKTTTMPQDSRYLYLCIFEQRPSEIPHLVPIGFLKFLIFEYDGGRATTLVELRAECSKRGYMGQSHEFMFSSSSRGMMCPVASIDERMISVEEYAMVSCRFSCCSLCCIPDSLSYILGQ